MIIGLLGFVGVGKDTVADILTKNGFQKIAFADRLKRVCREIFDFNTEQLWGTVAQKEAPDERYPREHVWNCSDSAATHDHEPYCVCCKELKINPDRAPCFLTPRYAMKTVGTEGGRASWSDIWVKRALDDAHEIRTSGWEYSQKWGFFDNRQISSRMNVVFSDCRYINEVEGVWKAGGLIYRVKRPGYDEPASSHTSETEQLQISDDRLQGVILNDGTPGDLEKTVLSTVRLS